MASQVKRSARVARRIAEEANAAEISGRQENSAVLEFSKGSFYRFHGNTNDLRNRVDSGYFEGIGLCISSSDNRVELVGRLDREDIWYYSGRPEDLFLSVSLSPQGRHSGIDLWYGDAKVIRRGHDSHNVYSKHLEIAEKKKASRVEAEKYFASV